MRERERERERRERRERERERERERLGHQTFEPLLCWSLREKKTIGLHRVIRKYEGNVTARDSYKGV